MERVGIERPSARPPGERAFEDGADDLYACERIGDGFPRAKVDRERLRPHRESGRPSAGANDGADLVAREARSADDGTSDQSARTEDRNPSAPRTIAATE